MRVVGELGTQTDLVEAVLAEEAARTVIGIAALIMPYFLEPMDDLEIPVLTVVELGDKVATGKYAGRLGVVQETIRVDDITGKPESPRDSLLGAMEEIVAPEDVGTTGHHFHRVLFPLRPEVPLRSLEGNKAGGIELVIFTGNKITSATEVTDPQFVPAGRIIADGEARPTSRELVYHAVTNRLLSAGQEQHRRGLTVPVFSEVRDFGQFLSRRNGKNKPDITEIRR